MCCPSSPPPASGGSKPACRLQAKSEPEFPIFRRTQQAAVSFLKATLKVFTNFVEVGVILDSETLTRPRFSF